MHIGVIAALGREARLLAGPRPRPGHVLRLRPGVSLYLCGIGQERAARGAAALLEAGCAGLVSFGTAGGLLPDLPSGTLVIPEFVVDEEGGRLAVDGGWRGRLLDQAGIRASLPPQILASVARVLTSREDKEELARSSGACAVDMESAAVARLARGHAVPLLVVRAVADAAAQQLPRALLTALNVYGEPRWPALFKALAAQPGMIGCLPGLARGMRAAERGLAALVARTGPGFAV